MNLTPKSLLQLMILLGGFVPVLAGLSGVLVSTNFIDPGIISISVDSHFRYLSGLLLGLGLCFWSTIPTIERRDNMFPKLAAVVALGGLARVWSLIVVGKPSVPMIFGLVMELGVTPLLALWQYRVSRKRH